MRGLVVVACLFLDLANAFNLNWNHARVFTDGNHGSSYFGFAVDFRRDGHDYKLLVGAPKGAPDPENKDFVKMRGIAEPGVTFQCDIKYGAACSLLKMDVSGNVPLNAKYVVHKKDRGWFGGTLAINDDQKKTVVCAPKWKNSYHKGHYLMNGICYLSDEPNYTPRTNLLMPLVNRSLQSYNHTEKNDQVFNYAYGEAGFTAHFPKGSTDLILGAPGVFDWQGAIIRYKEGPYSRYEKPEIPSSLRTKGIYDNNYLGYSLSSGKFFRNDPKTYYVSGAPRAADYKGQVFFFEFPDDMEQGLVVKLTREGTQMGEYFGGALCVADVNGDGLDDLIVGAPQHSLRTQNAAQSLGDEGRIYVYINDDKGMTEVTANNPIMGRRKHGARFGTAIANVGDLNFDGLEDVAVGAPYEGAGVVYIYHGRRTGTPNAPLEWVQTIEASSVSPALKGLGISFSKGLDVDGNYYNDVAVGAFESGHAVLLRGHPIITFHSSLSADVKRILEKTNKFTVEACLAYTGAYAPETVDSTMSLKVDSATNYGRGVIAQNGQSSVVYNDALRNASNSCRNITILVKDDIKDPSKPIDIMMNFDLMNNLADQKPNPNPGGPDGFCRDCPVVDIFQSKSRTIRVPFETGCKTDVCSPDLSVHVTFTDVKDEALILGVQQTLEMVVEILNKGDPAYLPELKIVLPNETPLTRYPQNCQNVAKEDAGDNHVLRCDVGNSLIKNSTIRLQMDVKDVSVKEKRLVFEVNATSSGDEATPQDNYRRVTLDLLVRSDMTITGVSSREQIVYISQNNTIMKDLHVNHTFEILNIGPSKVEAASINFLIPIVYKNGTTWHEILDIYRPKSTLTYNQNVVPIECRMTNFAFRETYNNKDDSLFVPIPFENEPEETLPEHHSNRTRRAIDVEDTPFFTMTDQTPLNKTLFLHCGHPSVDCARVECEAGPFFASKSRAIIVFPMQLKNLEFIGELATKEITLFSVRGQVLVNHKRDGNRPDEAIVQTMFLGKVNVSDGGVPSWIIAVAIISGLLLLSLIAMMLHKMGFFKRAKKDELEALKEAEAEADADE